MSRATARLSRRHFLVGAALLATQSTGIVATTINQWRREYNQMLNGFVPLSSDQFSKLADERVEYPVTLWRDLASTDREQLFSFNLAEETTVYLAASADSADATFVYPLIVQLQSKRRHVLPLIQSATDGRRIQNVISLGRFEAGEHQILISLDEKVTRSLPSSLVFRASRPATKSLFSNFVEHSPVLKLRNLNNVLDDIPLVGYNHVYIHPETGFYLVSSHIIFSSENGGTKPPDLYDAYGRTLDVEWVMKQVFRPDGSILAARQRFQSRNHGTRPYKGEEWLGSRPVLVTATPNNNFSDDQLHFGRWSLPNPFASSSDSIYYSPKPIFLPPGNWSSFLLKQFPELQEWSMYEVAMEGCVDLSDRSKAEVQEFAKDLELIRESLQVSFPSRGCSSRKLSVP